MRIRKLELQGFKSFVDRQAFHFGEGISGVVGPNGCGKSNIVDAIKWVVGEQSAKSLRGQAMQDVIFNGSEGRKKVGLAEVVVTFQRGARPFPGDYARFEEIRIGRRLYRDGSSEYLINQVRVRRKDIIDLLLDTGIGNKLYSFIEQGQIGQIVQARPEQRRGLLEEAAGISRFKARKHETEQKLQLTEQNLDRATDVAEELGRRLRTLERQVEKAARYRRLQATVRQNELYLGLAQYAALSGDRRALHERHRDGKRDVEQLTRDVERRDAELQGSRDEIAVMQTVVGRLRDEIAELEAQRRELDATRRLQARESAELERRVEGLVRDLDEAGRQQDQAVEEHEHTTEELRTARATLDDRDALFASQKKEAEELGGRLHAVRSSLEDSKSGHMAKVTGLVRRKTRMGATAQRLEQLGAQTEGIEPRLSEALRRVEALAAEAAEAAGRVDAAEALRIATADDAQRAREKLRAVEAGQADLQRTVRRADDAVAKAARAVGGLDARVQSLEALQAARAGVEGGARDVLDALDTHGLLAEHLPGCDELVELAMGADLDTVLLKRREQLEEAIAICGERTSLRVVDLGDLSRPEVRVFESLDEALDANEAGVVPTLGVRVEADGTVRAGREVASGTVLLERQREISQLRDQLQAARRDAGASEAAAAAARDAMDVGRQAIDTARDELERLRGARRAAEQDLAQAQNAAKDLARSLESGQERLARMKTERSRVAREQESLHSRRSEEQAAIAVEEEQLVAIERELTRLQAEMAELETSTARAREAAARARTEQSAVKERVVLLQRAAESAAGRRDQAIERGQRAAAELETARERLAFLEQDDQRIEAALEELAAQQGDNRDRLGLEAERLRKSQDAIAGSEETLRERRGQLQQAQSKTTRWELKLQEVKLGIDTLRQGVEARYQVSLPGLLDRLERDHALILEAGEDAQAELPVPGLTLEPVEDLRIVPADVEDEALVRARVSEFESAKATLGGLGEVNLAALQEYTAVAERHAWLEEQRLDLEESVARIRRTVAEINRTCRERFREAFDKVDAEFRRIYPRLVGGGQGRLRLTNDEDLLETGVDIFVQPPGKRLQNLTLLSGGEKAMCAIGLLFALFRVKPSPFCLLDEVDAPLDESNGARFNAVLKEMSELTQFIVITHNKKTMEVVDTLYGVTMPDPGISRLVSVNVS